MTGWRACTLAAVNKRWTYVAISLTDKTTDLRLQPLLLILIHIPTNLGLKHHQQQNITSDFCHWVSLRTANNLYTDFTRRLSESLQGSVQLSITHVVAVRSRDLSAAGVVGRTSGNFQSVLTGSLKGWPDTHTAVMGVHVKSGNTDRCAGEVEERRRHLVKPELYCP